MEKLSPQALSNLCLHGLEQTVAAWNEFAFGIITYDQFIVKYLHVNLIYPPIITCVSYVVEWFEENRENDCKGEESLYSALFQIDNVGAPFYEDLADDEYEKFEARFNNIISSAVPFFDLKK